MMAGLVAVNACWAPTLPHSLLAARRDVQLIYGHKAITQFLADGAPAYHFKSKIELHNYVTNVAKRYGLPVSIMKQIVAVESNNCRFRYNTVTHDGGCFQINALTIAGYNWNAEAAIKNDMLNVHAAAIVLSDFKRKFAAKEPTSYYCRYNIGFQDLPSVCAAYLHKLSVVQY